MRPDQDFHHVLVEVVDQENINEALMLVGFFVKSLFDDLGIPITMDNGVVVLEEADAFDRGGDTPSDKLGRGVVENLLTQLNHTAACRIAIDHGLAEKAALHAFTIGLALSEGYIQRCMDFNQNVSGGKARAQKQAEAAGPIKKAAREIRREITSKLSLTAQAQYVRKKLIERQKNGKLVGKISSEKTLGAWFRADDKRH